MPVFRQAEHFPKLKSSECRAAPWTDLSVVTNLVEVAEAGSRSLSPALIKTDAYYILVRTPVRASGRSGKVPRPRSTPSKHLSFGFLDHPAVSLLG